MTKKIIEYEAPSCDIRYSNMESIEQISKSMEAIEKHFYDIEITSQKYDKDNMLIGESIVDTSMCILKSITVILDYASDEFYLELENPIIRQEFNGTPKYDKNITIEVVTEETAKSNDHDFLSSEELENYEVGGTNSYYKALGKSTYYYREM